MNTRRPTHREVSLAPLKYRVERGVGSPLWIAYRDRDGEHGATFRTWRAAMRYALMQVARSMAANAMPDPRPATQSHVAETHAIVVTVDATAWLEWAPRVRPSA